MNPTKVKRDTLSQLTDLPNVGKAIAEDLRKLEIHNRKTCTDAMLIACIMNSAN